MSIINKEQKDKLIGGVIGVLLIALTLYVKSFFSKEEKPINNNQINSIDNQNEIISSHDSSQQKVTINKVDQDNLNSKNVNTDIISGNKNINNYFEKTEKTTKTIESIPKINNNEGFVNIGGNNNVYNQNINPKPKPRKLNYNDQDEIIEKIPKNYLVELFYCSYDEECNSYGKEIEGFLSLIGYAVKVNLVGIMAGRQSKDRIDIEIMHPDEKARVIIHPQKRS